MLLFLDLETTGLDPLLDNIMEIGYILTYDDLSDVGIAGDELIWPGAYARRRMSEKVREMHTKNGLLEELKKRGGKLAFEYDAELSDELKSVLEKIDEPIRIAGFGPHFDKAFLAHHMPLTHSLLSHRIYDVRTIQAFVKETTGYAVARGLGGEFTPHRAYPDAELSLKTSQALHLYAMGNRR